MIIDLATTEALRAAELELLDVAVRTRATSIARLLHDDFLEFGSSGRAFDKAAIIEALSDDVTVARTVTNFAAHLLSPGVALVTYQVAQPSDDGGTVRRNRSSIWMWVDDRWQMRFHQGTPIPTEIGG